MNLIMRVVVPEELLSGILVSSGLFSSCPLLSKFSFAAFSSATAVFNVAIAASKLLSSSANQSLRP